MTQYALVVHLRHDDGTIAAEPHDDVTITRGTMRNVGVWLITTLDRARRNDPSVIALDVTVTSYED